MLKKLNKNQKGFTLVELIIVIAILGVLAALLAPRIMGNVDDAQKNKHVANARTLASEITTYNALKTAEDDSAAVIKSKTPLVFDDIKDINELKVDAADFPKDQYVEINVDDKGNASIKIK